MSAIWKKGKPDTVAIDLGKKDIYGLDGSTFQCFYGNPDGTTTDVGTFSEFVKDISDPQSCTASGGSDKGTKDVKVDDVTGWKVGMVAKVKDKNIYFYVEAVNTDDNILTARNALSDDIADGDEIDEVGNTGIYGTSVTLDVLGIHFFVIRNPSIGLMNKSKKVEVVEYDDTDVINKLEDIEDKIDNLGGIDGEMIV